MATITEQPKPPAVQDHPYPPNVVPYPQPYSPPFPPPPPGYPPFFAYPPPGDATHPENGQSPVPPAPYMMAFAPSGMVYAYPTPQGAAFPPPATSVPPALAKPKRKQVKMACTNCAAACKRCDESRPCERCIKYGMSNTCIDGQRKERKKGIKRGPYKRKNKGSDTSGSYPPGQPPPPPASASAAAAVAPPAPLPVPHQFPAPEGFYPVYYGPPGPFMPHPPDPQHNPDGSPASQQQQQQQQQQPPPPPPPLPHHHPPPPPPPHVGVNGQMISPYFYAAYPPFSHYPPMFPPPHPPLPPHGLGGPPPPGAVQQQQPPPPPPPAPQQQPPPPLPQTVQPGEVASGVEKNGEQGVGVPDSGGILANTGDSSTATGGSKKRTRGGGGTRGVGVINGTGTKRAKMTRAAVRDSVRPQEVEGDGMGEKDVDAEGEVVDENGNGSGSGNESSA